MSQVAQHAVVLLVVVGCVAFAGREVYRTFAGRRGRVGSCCDKGCGSAGTDGGEPKAERVVFLPSSSLTVTRRKS